MKNEKGITLVSLVVYIVVLTIVIAIITTVSSFFYSNINYAMAKESYAPEFNKFNMYFIEDVKNNKNAIVNTTSVEFEDGTKYTFDQLTETIYRNDLAIAENVKGIIFSKTNETVRNTTKTIIKVEIGIGEDEAPLVEEIDYVLKYW